MHACTQDLFDGYLIRKSDYPQAYERANLLLQNSVVSSLRSCHVVLGSLSFSDRRTSIGVTCPVKVRGEKVLGSLNNYEIVGSDGYK